MEFVMTKKFYLNCPFDEKDMCKSLGGRWDNDARMWFVPEDLDETAFKRWWFADDKQSSEEKSHLRLV